MTGGSDIPGGSVRKMRVAKESMDTGVVRTYIYGVWALSDSFIFIDVRLTSTCGLRHHTALRHRHDFLLLKKMLITISTALPFDAMSSMAIGMTTIDMGSVQVLSISQSI